MHSKGNLPSYLSACSASLAMYTLSSLSAIFLLSFVYYTATNIIQVLRAVLVSMIRNSAAILEKCVLSLCLFVCEYELSLLKKFNMAADAGGNNSLYSQLFWLVVSSCSKDRQLLLNEKSARVDVEETDQSA